MTDLILLIFGFVYPLFYLFLTYDPTEVAKMTLLGIIVPLLLFLSSIRLWRKRELPIPRNPYLPVLLLLIGTFTVSGLTSAANIVIPLTTPSSLSSLWLLFGLFLLLSSLDGRMKRIYLYLTIAGSALISIIVIFIYLGIIPQTVILPSGSLLTTCLYLTVISAYLLAKCITDIKYRKNPLYIIALLLIVSAALVLAYHLNTDQKALLLPHSQAVWVFSKIVGNPKDLLIGVGPTQFISAFTKFKQASINDTPLWNITFSTSSSFFLNLLTEGGILSGLLYLSLFFITLKYFRRSLPILLSLAVIFILQMIFPSNMALLYLMFLLMAFSVSPDSRYNWHLPRFLALSLPILCFLLFLGIGYLSIRNFLAESFYKSSYDSLSEKKGSEVYNMQRNAVILNPYSDKYHLALSQTSLALADSFARIENPSNEEKQQVTKLAQQAIEEAQRAVSANRENFLVWDNLSKIYGALQKFAIGSDDWAIEGAEAKIKLDPANPNSYLSLGTLYFSLEKYREAENSFRQAIELKQDLPSARFNLALSLKAQGKIEDAKREFEITLRLLPAGSPDLNRVQDELNGL